MDELEGLYNLRHFHVLTTAARSYINNGSLDSVHACLQLGKQKEVEPL